MGFHNWVQQCPYCGFEEMSVSTWSNFNLEVACPICGYGKWTEEKIPECLDVETAKRKLIEMNSKDKLKAKELYYEEKVSLVERLKDKD